MRRTGPIRPQKEISPTGPANRARAPSSRLAFPYRLLPGAGLGNFALAGLAALVMDGSASAGPTDVPDARTPPGTLVGISSHRLHIHCTGQGSPSVIFESGLGGTSLDWVRVQPAVSGFTRACSYDRAGYGWSDLGPPPRHAVRIARELERLLTQGHVPPPYVLVGHSFGGLVIRLFVARKERRAVAGLVLVDATHEQQFDRMETAGARSPMAPTGRRFVIANLWSVPNALPETLKPLAQRLALARKSIRTLYGELGSMRYSARQVNAIRRRPEAPVIVLARGPRPEDDSGHDSRLDRTWLDLQRDLARSMKNGSFQVVPDSGHYIHLERPGRVVRAIRTIVDAYRVQGKAADPARTADAPGD